MRYLFTGLLIIYSSLISIPAIAQDKYEIKGKAHDVQQLKGDWDGKHTFPKVYCTTFPTPKKAKSLRYAFSQHGAIYLVHVYYPNDLIAAIAVSTVPATKSSQVAFEQILSNERRYEEKLKKAGLSYTISEFPGAFGPVVGVVSKNTLGGNKQGPFPLTRSVISNPKQPIVSLSVHRLFVRGHDRFELAVIQRAPKPSTDTTEVEMTKSLTTMADEMLQSLQKCTASIPIRIPK